MWNYFNIKEVYKKPKVLREPLGKKVHKALTMVASLATIIILSTYIRRYIVLPVVLRIDMEVLTWES